MKTDHLLHFSLFSRFTFHVSRLTFHALGICVLALFAPAIQAQAPALTITNVAVAPNPFSPNGDGVQDETTIRFVLSDDPGITRVEITFDQNGNGLFEAEPDDLVEEVTTYGVGENRYLWPGGSLSEGFYQFRIAALSGTDVLADAFGSVIIDLGGPTIENVIVSLSPFSPNGDGINDVTEIVFDLSGTNPPGYQFPADNQVGTISFDIPGGISSGSITFIGGNQPVAFPFGVRLAPVPDGINSPIDELVFSINGQSKGTLVSSQFTISPNGILAVGEGLYDLIFPDISNLSASLEPGATSAAGTASLNWFTGNAVVNIFRSDGSFIESLPISPIYTGDGRYHVRWEPPGLSDGVYTFRILAEGGAGNVAQRSGEIVVSNTTLEITNVQITADRISPEDANLQNDSTRISFDLSKPSTVTAQIVDASDQLVRILIPAESKESGPQSVVWDGKDDSGAVVSPGGETRYTYITTAVDRTNSDTAKVSGTIVVDNQPPPPPQLNPPQKPWTNSSTFEVTGTAEPGATVEVFVGTVSAGLVVANETSGEFGLSSLSLKVGVNPITAFASDSVANTSGESSNTVDIHFDRTPPVTVPEDIPPGWQQGTVTVRLIGQDELGGSGVAATHYTSDGTSPDTASPTVGPDGLIEFDTDGVFLLRFFSVDNAGNTESAKQASDSIRIDTTPPSVVGIDVQAVSTFEEAGESFFENVPILIVSGMADDGSAGSGVKLVEIQVPALSTQWMVVSGTSDWQHTFIPDVLLDSYDIQIRATNNAGNQIIVSTTITLDAQEAPMQLVATPISDGRIRLTWPDDGQSYNLYRTTFSQFSPGDETLIVAGVTGGVFIDGQTTDQTEFFYKIGLDASNAQTSVEAVAIADKTPPAIENISAVPNPFSPNNDGVDDITTIAFTLTEETFVTLIIYPAGEGDVPILGAPARTLIADVLSAGDNLVNWDGRDETGNLVDEGVYVYRFEKTMTLDASGKTLLQDISGSITDTLAPPLEIRVIEAQPNPFSPDGDRINDLVNLNYTLSDFSDFVAVNIITPAVGSQTQLPP